MRRLILSMNMSLDGFSSGPKGELDWHFNYWDEEMARATSEQLAEADSILFGRITYNAMGKYWSSKTAALDLSREDLAFADMMNNHRKIVFSKTMSSASWKNSVLIKGNVRKEMLRIKQTPGGNIMIYGSSKLVHSLMQWNLIDEYRLWLHPVLLGKGKPLFENGISHLPMQLCGVRKFGSGVVLVSYKVN